MSEHRTPPKPGAMILRGSRPSADPMAKTVPVSNGGSDHSFQVPTVAVIAPDQNLIDQLKDMPLIMYYQYVSPVEYDFVKRALKLKPAVVVVCSDGNSVISGQRICEQVKKLSNIPVVFINNGEYANDFNFTGFADVDAPYPSSYEERFNLVIELGRIAHNVPLPGVRLGMMSLARSRAKWVLLIVPVVFTLSAVMVLRMTNDLALALHIAAIMAFAITGVEVSPAVVRRIFRSLSGRQS